MIHQLDQPLQQVRPDLEAVGLAVLLLYCVQHRQPNLHKLQ